MRQEIDYKCSAPETNTASIFYHWVFISLS